MARRGSSSNLGVTASEKGAVGHGQAGDRRSPPEAAIQRRDLGPKLVRHDRFPFSRTSFKIAPNGKDDLQDLSA